MKARNPGFKSTIWMIRKKKVLNQSSKKKKEFKKMRPEQEASGTSPNV